MRGIKTNENKTYPNINVFIALFCIAALFEAAFLGLVIQNWSISDIVAYAALILVLQIAACLKAVCVWYIHRRSLQVIVYLNCVAITSLLTYLIVEVLSL